MHRLSPEHLWGYSSALVVGAACTLASILNLVAVQKIERVPLAILAIFLLLFFSGILHLLFSRVIFPRLAPFPQGGKALWAVGALAAGLLLTLAIPLPQPPYSAPTGAEHHLAVVATGQKDPASKGSEVWVIGIYGPDGRQIPTSEYKLVGHWEMEEGVPVSAGQQPATITWDGRLSNSGQLKLAKSPQSGIAQITWDNRTQTVDLYSAERSGTNNSYTFALPSGPTQAETWVQKGIGVVAYAADAIVLGLVLWVFSILLATRPERAQETGSTWSEPRVGSWSWILYALPCAVIWTIYLLAYWPGVLTPDSITQWMENTTGRYDNLHPAFHTLTNWLITRIWLSPAAIAIVQIIALAVVFGLVMRELEHWRVPLWIRVAITAVFSLSVVNGLMVITLWKDIFYSTCILGLFAILLCLVRTKGRWLASPWSIAIFSLLLLCITLFRHNGAAVSVPVLILVFFIWKQQYWKQILLTGAASLAMYAAITGPVYTAVPVQPIAPYFAMQPIIHQVGAMVSANVPLNQSEKSLLGSIQPLSSWRQNYTCVSAAPLIFNESFQARYFDLHASEFLALWKQLALAHPEVVLQHVSCVTGTIWRISQVKDDGFWILIPEVSANAYGLKPDSRWPFMADFLSGYEALVSKPEDLWWSWRPALYLYITVFCVIVAAIRLRSRTILILAAPVVANSVALLILSVAQDFRYQYPIYLIGLVAPALLFANPWAPAQIPESTAPETSEAVRTESQRVLVS